MRVILTADVDSVGKMGEIKEVKNGLARNYLIPQKLAIRATPGNIKVWGQKSKIIQKREEGLRDEAQGFASNLDGASVTITVKVGEENKLFGSVTSQNISDALKELGFEVSRKNIELDSPIKELGAHDVSVKLYQDVVANIKVEVQGEDADGNKVEVIAEVEPEPETEAVEAAESEAETEAKLEPEQEVETEALQETAVSEPEQEEITEEEAEATDSQSEEIVEVEPEEAEEETAEAEEPKEEKS